MDQPISVTQALNNLQSWLNAGDYTRVIQGCMEVLKVEPGNQRALALMKLAEERRYLQESSTRSTMTPTPATPPVQTGTLPTQEEVVLPTVDPLAKLAVDTPSTPKSSEDPYGLCHIEDSEDESKVKLFLTILIPALLVILIAGAVILFIMNRTPQDGNSGTVLDELPSTHYLAENEKRVENLTLIARAVEDFKNENGAFPSVDQIETVLINSPYFEELPIDPRHGGTDNAGNTFGYIYAVYPSLAGENTAYIVSALFEDSEGFGYSWTQGASPSNHTDYMDLEKENVVLIGAEQPKIKR